MGGDFEGFCDRGCSYVSQMDLPIISQCFRRGFWDKKNTYKYISDVKFQGGSNGANGLKIGGGEVFEIRLQRVFTESVLGSF